MLPCFLAIQSERERERERHRDRYAERERTRTRESDSWYAHTANTAQGQPHTKTHKHNIGARTNT